MSEYPPIPSVSTWCARRVYGGGTASEPVDHRDVPRRAGGFEGNGSRSEIKSEQLALLTGWRNRHHSHVITGIEVRIVADRRTAAGVSVWSHPDTGATGVPDWPPPQGGPPAAGRAPVAVPGASGSDRHAKKGLGPDPPHDGFNRTQTVNH